MTYRVVMPHRVITSAALSVSALLVSGVVVASPSLAEENFSTTADNWADAAAALGTAGSLWDPTDTLGMNKRTVVDVVADNLEFSDGDVTAGDTATGAQYGTKKRGFAISEKWANTGWAADPAYDTGMAPVGTTTIKLGEPGVKRATKVKILANCWVLDPSNPQPAPKGFRCTKADVLKTGGVLQMTAKPASTMTEPGNTTIVIETTGMTYKELLAIARGLEQVIPPVTADSAMTTAICSQMIDGKMTQAQANTLATGNGYTTRVGEVDGVPNAVTADYRPDRYTLTITGGIVTACPAG